MTPLIISLAMALMAAVTGIASVLAFRWHRRWKVAMAVMANWQETIPALERERVIAVSALNAATRRIDELEEQAPLFATDSNATRPILDAQEAAAPTEADAPVPVKKTRSSRKAGNTKTV